MSTELYSALVKLVDDVSALGLRHVGYNIPTDFFGPFVSCAVEQFMAICDNVDAIEGQQVNEGFTVAEMEVK